jgi:hypothetical protein
LRAVQRAGGGKLKVAVRLGRKTAVQTWSLAG